MKPRPQADDGGSDLDSLMDTMTNVVGILIMVLVMTQMDVQEAVRRITEKSTVTAADLDAAKQQLLDLDKQSENMTSSLDISTEKERLKRMQETLAAKRKALIDSSEESRQFAMKIATERTQAAEAQKQVELSEEERKKVQDQITEALKKKADLQARLDKTPMKAVPPPKIVSIPNPRPAPEGAKQLNILCANNRLYPMNIDDIRKETEERAKELIVKQKLNLNPLTGIDPEKFESFYLIMKPPRDDYLNVEYYVDNKTWPRIRLLPNPEKGATVEELEKPRSPISRLLTGIDPQRFFVVFLVMPDSYDVYITARAVLMKSGLQAGWEPQSAEWVYTTSVPGGIRLGPPPPPAPPPDPNAPKPPPPKPANVID